ncbi:MAG TPA: hypothetical protein VHI52_15845, partial [Verrucomicrobiae bacterium]|nr:hypothetical protein [Verrucomicrobiae bacterium]
ANPRNRWVLSTNPDMLFVPRKGRTLTAVVRELPDGYYATPRYELPESLWESFERSNPGLTLEEMRKRDADRRLHLAVRSDPWNGYDAPGDFQLMPLRDAIAIGGFHEGMVRGWHVDSNLSKRASLLYQRPANLLHDELFAYHMMHLRMLTSGHTGKAGREANSLKTFVDQAATPVPDDQPGDWGLPGRELEEIRLNQQRRPFWLLGQSEKPELERAADDSIEFAEYHTGQEANMSWHAPLERIQFYLANSFDYLPSGLTACVWSGNPSFQDFMRRVARDKHWELSVVTYSPQGKTSVNPELQERVPALCLFDFTAHFLPRASAEEFGKLRSHFHTSLVAELTALAYRVSAATERATPTLYCLGVGFTEIEGFLASVTPDWDQVPLALGFRRGRFSAADRNSRVGEFVKWQSARVRMAARLRGQKTVSHKIALECLRFLGRFDKGA